MESRWEKGNEFAELGDARTWDLRKRGTLKAMDKGMMMKVLGKGAWEGMLGSTKAMNSHCAGK